MRFSKFVIYFLNWDLCAKRILLLFLYPWTIHINRSPSSLKRGEFEGLDDFLILLGRRTQMIIIDVVLFLSRSDSCPVGYFNKKYL